MAAKRTHDVVATVGKYTDAGGAEKKRYANVGSAFTDDQGRVSIKLDTVPVTPEWSGWLSLYPVESRKESRPQREERPPSTREPEQDDIPF